MTEKENSTPSPARTDGQKTEMHGIEREERSPRQEVGVFERNTGWSMEAGGGAPR